MHYLPSPGDYEYVKYKLKKWVDFTWVIAALDMAQSNSKLHDAKLAGENESIDEMAK